MQVKSQFNPIRVLQIGFDWFGSVIDHPIVWMFFILWNFLAAILYLFNAVPPALPDKFLNSPFMHILYIAPGWWLAWLIHHIVMLIGPLFSWFFGV